MGILNSFLRSSIFNNFNNFFIRKLFKIFKFFFVETNLEVLPEKNYPVKIIDTDFRNAKDFLHNNSKPYISYSHLSDLILILSKDKNEFNFFDFGAGDLKLFYYLKRKFKALNYYFKDQELVEKEVGFHIESEKVERLFLINENKVSKIDLLYFGSSLQYVNDYKKILSAFFKKSNYILISQTPFFDNPLLDDEIVLKQLNMHPNINYLYMFNFEKFADFMNKNDFFLTERNVNKVTKFLNFKNFDKNKYKNLNMYDLLFVRKL